MEVRDGSAQAYPFRVAYDARLGLGQFRGMGRFLRQLIAGRESDFYGLAAQGDQDDDLRLIASGPRFYPVWEQMSVPALVRKNKIDIFIAPYNTAPLHLPSSTVLVLVVHDLIFMESLPWSRSAYQNLGRVYRRVVVPRAVERADVLLTVSDYTASQLRARFAVAPDRLQIIPNSLGRDWFASPGNRGDAEGYLLVVAGEAPSKNLSRALEAYAMCGELRADRRMRLVVAGVKKSYHPFFRKQAEQLGIAEDVDFLPYLQEEEMRHLYRRAQILLMPSLCEGFGIPVVEAMASGTPVVCSSATCLPEIGGNAACYFDPYSVASMSAAIQEVYANPALQEEMSLRGLMQAQRFHPDRVQLRIQSFWDNLERMESARVASTPTELSSLP